MAKKLSKEMEEKLKTIYPESRGLDFDRRFDAKKMLDPSKPDDLQKWIKDPKHSDIKGFDDTSAKEPSIKKVAIRVAGGDSGDEVLQDEPERMVDPASQAGKLIQANKDKIVDYASFVKVVKSAWRDDDALPSLLDNVKNDNSFKEMFKHPTIQGYVDANTKPAMINYIMKKFNVEPVRASNIVNRLNTSLRAKLYSRAKRTKLPRIIIPKGRARPRARLIGRQTTTRRAWSEQEHNIIRANKESPTERVAEIFNTTTGYNRSYISIRNKLYRIRRDET